MATQNIPGYCREFFIKGSVRLIARIFSLPSIVGISSIGISLWLWQEANIQQRYQIERKVHLATQVVKTEVQAQMDARIVGLRQMAHRWQIPGWPTRREWKSGSQAYIDFFSNCQTIQWLDTSFQPRWTTSQDGVAPPVVESHKQRLAAYDRNWPSVIVVRSLSPQASQQLWVYIPVFDKQRLSGFIFAAFRTEDLFKTTRLNDPILSQYGLSVLDGNKEIFKRDNDGLKNAQAWVQEISLPLNGVTLRSRLWPSSQMLAQEQSQLPDWLLGTTVLAATFLALNLEQAQKARRQAKKAEMTHLGFLVEIDTYKQAEADLRRHVQMIDSASDAILIRDLDDLIIYWNQGAERLYGWNQKEVAGKYIHKQLKTIFPQPLEEVLATCHSQGYWEGELIHTKHDGGQIVVSSRWTLQRDQAGNPSAILEINHNISDRKRTEELLHRSEWQLREQATQLEEALRELQNTQSQLIQSEKLSSLGQLVAGVAHEINNPVNFIYGNLSHAREYTNDLLRLVQLYQQQYPNPTPEIREEIEDIDLEFLITDLPKMICSMEVGADRIREIVQALRNFSRLDEAHMKAVDIHDGIESTLMILQNRLKAKSDRPTIQVIKQYGELPLVECYAGQLNQVFMNILSNAIDAIEMGHRVWRIEHREEEKSYLSDAQSSIPTISIQTSVKGETVVIRMADNGLGMTQEVRQRLFDPFFTTKPIGKGTGLGLSISYQIVVEKHGGKLECFSQPGLGAEFAIEIPLHQSRVSTGIGVRQGEC